MALTPRRRHRRTDQTEGEETMTTKKPKLLAFSKDRYRASAAERRQYGGATVTEFYVMRPEDRHNPSAWKKVFGYGKTPGERKTDAMKRSGLGGFAGGWLRRALGLGRRTSGPAVFAGAGRFRGPPAPARPASPASVLALGAATDDPVCIANRAARDARRADLAADINGRRMAAETTWLAVTAVADVAAARMGRSEPRSASERMETLQALEREAGVRRGSLTRDFDLARRVLHRECYHQDSCPVDLVEMTEDYRGVVAGGMAAVAKVGGKKGKR